MSAIEFFDEACTAFNAQDYAKAVDLWQKAADMGHAQAMRNLGQCYVVGQGVPRDITKGCELLRKAAAQGYEKAQSRLDSLKEQGLI